MEAVFVEAVRTNFGFLVHDHAFSEQPLAWDGKGISITHDADRLRVTNYLEADQVYDLKLIPMSDRRPPPLFDAQMDEPFTYFGVEDTVDPSTTGLDRALVATGFLDSRGLEELVQRRAQLLRMSLDRLLADDRAFLAEIRDRVRERQLKHLVPKWIKFVGRIEGGFDGSVSEYVGGVNVRGQIESIRKWPGKNPTDILKGLSGADRQFDALTVPMGYAQHDGLYPHPRARRWWRLPEDPTGRIRDYFFRRSIKRTDS